MSGSLEPHEIQKQNKAFEAWKLAAYRQNFVPNDLGNYANKRKVEPLGKNVTTSSDLQSDPAGEVGTKSPQYSKAARLSAVAAMLAMSSW